MLDLSTVPRLPPKTSSLGSTTIEWQEVSPGIALIYTKEGSIATRHLAHLLLAYDLESCGYQIYRDEMPDFNTRQATWTDVMNKAIRLYKDGHVTLQKNSLQEVIASVVGDHGVYTCYVTRSDPNSAVWANSGCTCLLAGSKIVMSDGTVKNIEDIQTGDLILTASGKTGKVARTFVLDYEGDIYGVKMTGSNEPVWMTADHKLFTFEGDVCEVQKWGSQYSYFPQPVQNKTIAELNVLDYIDDPRLSEIDGKLYKRNKLAGKIKPLNKQIIPEFSKCRTPFPAQIKLNENFARFAGLYIAEGCAMPDGEIKFSLGLHERPLAEEILELARIEFGIEGWIEMKPKKSNCVACFGCLTLAKLLDVLFGRGAKTKHIHPNLFNLSAPLLEIFVEAWHEGDGHDYTSRRTISTSSIDLAQQCRLVLALINRESVIWKVEDNSSKLVPGGDILYKVVWRANTNYDWNWPYHRVFDLDKQIIKQKMIVGEPTYYKGSVYNFEVLDPDDNGEDEHSYVIYPGIASANCPWQQFRWQRTRNFKRLEGRSCAHIMAMMYKSAVSPLEDEQQAPSFGQMPQQQQMTDMAPQQPGVATYPPNAAPSSDFNVLNQNDPWANAQPLQQPSMSPPYVTQEPLLQIPQQYEDYQKQLQQQTQNAPISIVQQNPPYPGNPIDQRGTLSHIIYADQGMQFQQGDTVRINVATMAQKEGPQGAIDQGEWIDINRGTQGEVFDVDATTGWCTVLFSMPGSANINPDTGRMRVPYDIVSNNARAYVESDMLSLVNRGGLKSPLVGNPNRNQSLT